MNLLDKLRTLYSSDEGWAIYHEVRAWTGSREGLTIADAVAVPTFPSLGSGLVGFELKVSRADWLRERARPSKWWGVGQFCARWYLVVPAPWKKIVLSLDELPEGWGLVEEARIIRESTEREAAPPTWSFLQSLLRAGARGDAGSSSAPLTRITRPHLSRHHVGLACGHIAPAPMAKKWPDRIPCFSCAEDRKPDVEVARAVIEEADRGTLGELGALIAERLGYGQEDTGT